MNHGIVSKVEEILTWAGKPMTVQAIAEQVELPDMWTEQKLRRNVACLLSGYEGKRWRRFARGRYVSKHFKQ